MIEPLYAFRERARKANRLQVTGDLRKRMAREVARWFMEQGKIMIAALGRYANDFDQNAALKQQATEARPPELWKEALSEGRWVALIDAAVGIGDDALRDIIKSYTLTAVALGANNLLADIAIGTSFDLANPRAVAWVGQRLDKQITRIDETTRNRVNDVVRRAVDEGWSWDRTARRLEEMYKDFAGPPLFPSRKLFSRSEAIAVFEIGDAYEAGQDFAVAQLQAVGLEMEQSWLTAGDTSVRPAHRANQAAGWIPAGATFPSNDDRPPTDPGCRCTRLFRRKPRDSA